MGAAVILLVGGLTAVGTGPANADGVNTEASALATARRTGQRVELTALRTPSRRVFVNPSGTKTLELGHSGFQYRWTHVNKADPDHSYWDNGREDGALVGVSTSPKGMFRSLFQMDTTPIAGAKVYQATFRILVNHWNFCRPTPLDLWHTKPIDPAVPLDWNKSQDYWLGGAPVASLVAPSCEQGPRNMAFATEALRSVVQHAADERIGFVTLGLRAPDERDWRQGLRIVPDSVVLAIDFNNPPNVPTVNTIGPTPCGTAAAPTMLSDSRSQGYSGSASDPDSGDNVTTRLEILRADGTIAFSNEVGPTVSGSSFSWSEVPAGTLIHGQTYHYRAVSRDNLDSSPYTRECYFTVDAIRPGVPRISSTEFPDGEPVIPARTTGTVTLRPAASDTDVTEYLFGFDQDRVTLRIKAGPDGSAVVPITVTENPLTGLPSGRLYVRALDAAGNPSPITPSWDLEALENSAPQAHVRGDATGDGRADVTTVLGHDFSRTAVWNITARSDVPGGFYGGYVGWDTGVGGGFDIGRIRYTRGDIDGDGRTDVAMFLQKRDGGAQLFPLFSDGNRYNAFPAVWDSGTEAWPLDAVRVLSGDVNGDGKADVVAQQAVPGGWRVLVFPGGAPGSPVTWLESTGDWQHASVIVGDVDGDGKADLVEQRDQGGCQTNNWVYRSSGAAFEAGVLRWDSGPGGYCADRGTPISGDVDGDGKADIVALYDNGGSDTKLMVFTAAGGLAPTEWWHKPGEFEAGRAHLSTGDFDLDGKDDLAVVYSCCAAGETQLWTLRSTGTAFADPVLGWRQVTGGVPAR